MVVIPFPPVIFEVDERRHLTLVVLSIQRSWISRMGRGFKKWCFSRPASSSPRDRLPRARRCFITPSASSPTPIRALPGATVALEETVERGDDGGVGERLEHSVVVVAT
jgi:hypothetical protein